jgi:PIN domain nuclease of toxin-antitoxin system
VKVLLDTHVLLWWLAAEPVLPKSARDVIADPDTVVVVSAATAWEIAIKRAKGRLEAPDDLGGALRDNAFENLPITVEHALAAGALPWHHADPFDRMLIAQAQLESLTLVTADPHFSAYSVDVLALN